MKVRSALFAAVAMIAPAFAATETTLADEPALSAKRLTGSLTVGYDSNYVGRGIVVSHSVAEGDSAEYVALKLNYDIGQEKLWSFDSVIAYKAVSSGHTLYGPHPYDVLNAQIAAANAYYGTNMDGIKRCNIENEFSVITGARYTGKYAGVAFGHQFVHGGLLGAMAKHFRSQGASNVNEFFVTPTVTPAPWFEAGVTGRYSFQGIQGWWWEPYVTFKAPIIGTPEDVKVAGVLTFAMSATCNYFDEWHGACANGAQAWWIKLSTPWFVTKNLILTPSVSFNWLGEGAQKANRVAKFKGMNSTYVPFRNFAVVAGVSCTYAF